MGITKNDLISRKAICDDIGKLIKEYRDECSENRDDDLADAFIIVRRYVINRAPAVDAIPVEWLEKRRENLILAAMVHSTVYGDNSVELCHAVNVVLDMWQKEQEART